MGVEFVDKIAWHSYGEKACYATLVRYLGRCENARESANAQELAYRAAADYSKAVVNILTAEAGQAGFVNLASNQWMSVYQFMWTSKTGDYLLGFGFPTDGDHIGVTVMQSVDPKLCGPSAGLVEQEINEQAQIIEKLRAFATTSQTVLTNKLTTREGRYCQGTIDLCPPAKQEP